MTGCAVVEGDAVFAYPLDDVEVFRSSRTRYFALDVLVHAVHMYNDGHVPVHTLVQLIPAFQRNIEEQALPLYGQTPHDSSAEAPCCLVASSCWRDKT